jgi:hypothetical protein
MKTRKIPLRKCIACQEMMAKKELIRVVKTPEDQILIDLSGKKSGRGAYLCGKVSCFKLARKQRSFDKALKHSVSADIYEQLEHEFVRVEDEFIAAKDAVNDDE